MIDDDSGNDHDNVFDVSNIDVGIDDHFISPLDLYDPRNWDILDAKRRHMLIKKGPIEELNITFPAFFIFLFFYRQC